MLLPFYSLIITFCILLVSFIAYILFADKLTFVRVTLALAISIVSFWPISHVMVNLLFYMYSGSGSAETINKLPFEIKDIPKDCNTILYYYDPTGMWFSCSLKKKSLENMLNERKMLKGSDFQCFTAKKDIDSIFTKNQIEEIEIYGSKMESNGAGKVALYHKNTNKLFYCRWYW